jgi:phytoene synthase
MGVSEEYDDEAARLGRAMQYINMIRDIGFDQRLGRTYIPRAEIMNAGLTGLEEHEARRHPAKFKSLVREEIHRYKEWSREGRSALHALPGPCRVAVKTASDMYNWTADELLEDPFKVYETPLKPSRARVLMQGGKNTLPWY